MYGDTKERSDIVDEIEREVRGAGTEVTQDKMLNVLSGHIADLYKEIEKLQSKAVTSENLGQVMKRQQRMSQKA